MVKKLTLILASLILAGCHHNPEKVVEVQTVEVYRPVLYCPAPNREGLDRPLSLAYQEINDSTTSGEVVKRYKASIVQLQEYIRRLEKTVDRYDMTSMAYDQLREDYIEQAREDWPEVR